jgi:SAM-dependent methyltransferase
MNNISPINYDAIAPKYDARYEQNPVAGVSRELHTLVTQSRARDVLDVGCGTGHWVIELLPLVRRIVDLDLKTVTDKLLDEAVLAFSCSFETLMASIAQKQQNTLEEKSLFSFSLGEDLKIPITSCTDANPWVFLLCSWTTPK